MKNLKVGQKIRAIDRCIMKDSGKPALIIGKLYPIFKIDKTSIYVESEIFGVHEFPFNEVSNFFHIIEDHPQIPELTGMEMEVSDNGVHWKKRIILGKYNGRYFTANCATYNYARPIQPTTIELTLEEIAKKFNVDKVIIKP